MNDLGRTDIIKLIALAEKPLNLRGVNLSMAKLMYLDLTGADLENANLGTELRGALLVNCYLYNADLTGATLKNADLTDADLTGALLKDADLTGATLKNADFSGTILE